MTEPKLDTSTPSSARVWNYLLGGKDNFAVDRAMGDQIREVFPEIVVVAQEQRKFLVRAVTFLADEVGIRQFLDIGTGLPTANNTHEVAQRVAPESRVVYVDNDLLVLTHAWGVAEQLGSPPLRRPNAYRNVAPRWTLLVVGRPLACAVEGLREGTARAWGGKHAERALPRVPVRSPTPV